MDRHLLCMSLGIHRTCLDSARSRVMGQSVSGWSMCCNQCAKPLPMADRIVRSDKEGGGGDTRLFPQAITDRVLQLIMKWWTSTALNINPICWLYTSAFGPIPFQSNTVIWVDGESVRSLRYSFARLETFSLGIHVLCSRVESHRE